MAASAHRVGIAAVRHSRLARAANAGAMEALEPLHDELAMSPVSPAAALLLTLIFSCVFFVSAQECALHDELAMSPVSPAAALPLAQCFCGTLYRAGVLAAVWPPVTSLVKGKFISFFCVF